MLTLRGDDVHALAATHEVEHHHAIHRRKQSIVLAGVHVQARLDPGSALTNQNISGQHKLTCITLDTQTLRIRIAPVAAGAATFFMSHFYLSLYLLDFFGVDFFAGALPGVAVFFAGAFASAFFSLAGLLSGFSSLVFGSALDFFATGFASALTTWRDSPGLPMKSTISLVYCWRCPPRTRIRFFGLYLKRTTFSPRKCSMTVALT